MDKRIIIILMFFSLFPLILAATDTQDVEDVFKLNERIDYSKPCFNNGSYCSASASCNFTIYYPNSSIFINETTAQNLGNVHNISFFVQDLGVSQVDMVCCDVNAACGSETMYFEVTGGGFNNSLGFFVIVLLLSFGVIIIGFWKLDPYITVLGTFGLYFLGLHILFNGIVGVKDLVTTWALGIIVLGIAAYISTRSAYEIIFD